MKIHLACLIAICLSLSAFADITDWDQRVFQFAQSPQWLGHFFYQRAAGGYASLVKSPAYFLTTEGRVSPEKELRAAIDFLMTPPPLDEKKYCQYVGRFDLILDHFSDLRKPHHHCAAFESWFAALEIDEVRFSFATGYMKNPASSFGHLFLKLISKKQKAELLNYGISFSAHTGADTGVQYALKGLFGQYPGGFSFLPYHQLIKDYSDLEGRDIWEMNLEMNSEQIKRLLLFIYEFDGDYIDYTFLTNNCAGILEYLIFNLKSEVVTGLKPWRIPLESFLRVYEDSENKELYYHASLKTQQKSMEQKLSGKEKQSIKQESLNKDFSKLGPNEIDYILLDKKSYTDREFDENYYHQLLLARSKQPVSKIENSIEKPRFQRKKTSSMSLVAEPDGAGIKLDLLTDRLLYRQSLSEINILNFKIYKNHLRELNIFDFLAGESASFLRQPVSFGGGISYLDGKGLIGNASLGLIYSAADWIYFPKLRLQGGDFSPELDLYFFMELVHTKVSASAYRHQVEILKLVDAYSASMSYSYNIETRSENIEFTVGRFF
ncbi:MAG: DUF4105 domain-containing protein [Bdellovibrionaceae bacterium]|nr:DUF4105 domain-containing protein [Pseudobdellovibrionaceae bacterium]